MKSMTAEQRNHMLLCDPVSSVIPKMAVPLFREESVH